MSKFFKDLALILFTISLLASIIFITIDYIRGTNNEMRVCQTTYAIGFSDERTLIGVSKEVCVSGSGNAENSLSDSTEDTKIPNNF